MADKTSKPWRLAAGREIDCAVDRIAGIVNVTPDSFYDGGRHDTVAAAVAHGLGLVRDGADMLDVGGESTRPGAAPVSEDQEIARVVPVIAGLAGALPGLPLSVDTYRAGCAATALAAGAAIVNDVSACAFDPGLLDVVAGEKPGYVLMHSLGRPDVMQNDPRYVDVVADILAFFEAKLTMLVAAGLPEDHIVLDPGIGFGKRPEHNLAILRHIDRFLCFGRPVYLGLSNKAFFGVLCGLPVGERKLATAIASALCSARGARIHRVHDAASVKTALGLAASLAA
ncbi:dihydropteroate synthase [Desulfovibrio sp. TomC]|uniref:dihydropteroate synthase n=1 Tax=Desulfovibrio sp. TomC TaxID=1562888 RepID=UPI000575CD5D|nr:dihydropteroate synthase [Desulfovibrio sp. TomC]KHK04493.1 Dihydropteroate synthase [Desulfovibrio sp. TomC]